MSDVTIPDLAGLNEELAAVTTALLAAERERCARIAEAETLTGSPPPHLRLHEIDLVKATVRATAKSIAQAIRSSHD